MFEQNNSSLYPAVFGEHVGLGFLWSETSAVAVASDLGIICAGIDLSPRISASHDLEPRITSTTDIVNC